MKIGENRGAAVKISYIVSLVRAKGTVKLVLNLARVPLLFVVQGTNLDGVQQAVNIR